MATRAAEIAQAEAYVQSRFYPPLPREYGALAVRAVRACNAGRPWERIAVTKLPVQPRYAVRCGNGQVVVEALPLVRTLRLEHLLDDNPFDNE